MRTALASIMSIIAVLAMSGLPVAAAGEGETLKPCASSLPSVGLDDLSTQMETPALPFSSTQATYVLDLAGNPVDKDTARVDVTISWDDPVSDFDTSVNDQSSSAITVLGQPSDGFALGSLKHCSFISVEVTNFSGSPLATISLDMNVR